jgi:hypothetical protein
VRRGRLGPAILALAALAACGSGPGAAPAAAPAPAVAALAIADPAVRTGDAPGQLVLSFTVPEASGTGVDAYDVRAQVRHADPAAAPAVSADYQLQASGARQLVTLRGLEEGRALQVAVRARAGSTWGPFSPSVAARVRAGPPPGPPPGAVPLSAPALLSQDGVDYVLASDVSTSGTAFTITGHGVSLDLAGHTITYGSGADDSYGVLVSYNAGSGTTLVRNGVIRQAGSHARCHGVRVRGAHDVRLTGLDVTVAGPDSDTLEVDDYLTGGLRVDHCRLHCLTSVVSDRHYPGVAAVWVEGAPGAVEIDANLVTASPQWGIWVSADKTTGPFLVHHNRVTGTKALVVNGYMIGVHKPQGDVFENELVGESRGIHLDGIDGHGHDAWVHDNYVVAQDQPNAEYPVHWCHGIKLEGASGALIEHNRVRVLADATHSEARAFDVTLGATTGNVVRENVFEGVSVDPSKPSEALRWTVGAPAASSGLVVTRNVFRATDRFVVRAWDSGFGTPFEDNLWERDLSQGLGHPFVFEHFETSDSVASSGFAFEDPITTESTTVATQEGTPAPYVSERAATFTVLVRDAAGAPLAGSQVVVRDRQGSAVLSRLTDAAGRAAGRVVLARVRNGPTVDVRGPFTISVTRAGSGTWQGVENPDGRLLLRVELAPGATTGVVDVTAPDAPAEVGALPLSASRAQVSWSVPAADDLACFLVRVDGIVTCVAQGSPAVVAGLAPASTHVFSVQAVDAGGNRSAAAAAAAITQPPEDRGP